MSLKLQTGTDNEVLRKVAKPIPMVTPELKRFAVDMVKTMEVENGVGLAAPQVGRSIRLIVVKLNPGEKNEIVFPMVNPEILEHSEAQEEGEEGCLSVPGVWGKVSRFSRILVRYKNMKNDEQTLELLHFNARIIQHEIDHLNGVLFVDKAFDLEEQKRTKKSRGTPEI